MTLRTIVALLVLIGHQLLPRLLFWQICPTSEKRDGVPPHDGNVVWWGICVPTNTYNLYFNDGCYLIKLKKIKNFDTFDFISVP
jgi:hypothetical protein